MSNWRARRYSVTIHRRHRVTITIRRFRLAKRSSKHRQVVVNIPISRIKQVNLEYRRLGRRPKPAALPRWQSIAAVLCVLIGIGGITYNAAALAKPSSLEPAQTFSTPVQPAPKPVTMAKSTPTHITISSQNIDADLVSVGLNADGSLETPPVLDWTAGWYRYSPTPGELGPAVIVGHVDSFEDISVFWNLRYVTAGDVIDVAREDGSIAHFKVTQLAQYDQDSFPTETVYGNTKQAELRVITCGGEFDATTGHYTENTVVFATLIP